MSIGCKCHEQTQIGKKIVVKTIVYNGNCTVPQLLKHCTRIEPVSKAPISILSSKMICKKSVGDKVSIVKL
jgi:hypothetical protein